MVRARVLITAVVIVALTMIAIAVGGTLHPGSLLVSETPLETGRPAALSLRATFSQSTRGELSAVELDLARGFHFDPRAAAVCTDVQAHAATCPATSTIGRGAGTIVVEGKYLPRTSYPVGSTFYLARPRRAGDVAGVVLDLDEAESHLHATMFGRVVRAARGPYGVALRFADAGTELPSGYTLSLLALTTLLQGHRAVSVNQHLVSYDLLTNPHSCPRHGWPVQVLLDSGGQSQMDNANAACS